MAKNTGTLLSALKSAWPLLLLLAGGLGAAAAWDLQISRAMFSPGAAWAVFIEKYGEIPGLLLSAWALLLLNAGLSGGKSRRIVLGLLNFMVCELLLEYALLNLVCARLGLRSAPEIAAFAAGKGSLIRLITAPAVLAGMLLLRFRLKDYALRHSAFARIAVIQLALSQLLVQTLKPLWGRVRFRDLGPGFSNFSPWYLPQGMPGNSSFPSGHTALAWMLLPAFLLCGRSPLLRGLCLGASIVWGIAVGLGRVTIGAHYASDVLFASLLTTVPFMIFLRLLRDKDKGS
ncbi:MAG: phosphatase PAP2 family protein [Elusimicrobiota bacterium]|nr:phosphatase PAP2 family protein [Elusimicrobiota bacterium]